MAADAITGDRCVIDISPGPTIGGVADITVTTGCNVVGRFARCGAAVMATRAAASNRAMVNIDLRPAVADMTTFAAVSRGNVAS